LSDYNLLNDTSHNKAQKIQNIKKPRPALRFICCVAVDPGSLGGRFSQVKDSKCNSDLYSMRKILMGGAAVTPTTEQRTQGKPAIPGQVQQLLGLCPLHR